MQYHIVKSLTTVFVGFPLSLRLLILSAFVLTVDLNAGEVFEVPRARSAFAPSAASFDGKIFLGWRGVGTPDRVENDQELYLAFRGAEGWIRKEVSIGKSMFGPVLASNQDRLFIAWHGAGNLFSGTGDPRLYLAAISRDGLVQHLGAVPDAVSAGPPGLAVHRGLVYVGWRAGGNITVGTVPGNQHWINFNVYDPKTQSWLGEKGGGGNIVHANGTSGPTFAAAGERLYVLWRGTGSITFYGPNSDPGDPSIYYGFLTEGEWSTRQLPLPIIPGALTAWSPGAVAWHDHLLVAWRGDQQRGDTRADSSVSLAWYDGNQNWHTIDLFANSKPRSAFAPSLAVDETDENLWMFWRGEFDLESGINDQQIYATTLSKASFETEAMP